MSKYNLRFYEKCSSVTTVTKYAPYIIIKCKLKLQFVTRRPVYGISDLKSDRNKLICLATNAQYIES